MPGVFGHLNQWANDSAGNARQRSTAGFWALEKMVTHFLERGAGPDAESNCWNVDDNGAANRSIYVHPVQVGLNKKCI